MLGYTLCCDATLWISMEQPRDHVIEQQVKGNQEDIFLSTFMRKNRTSNK